MPAISLAMEALELVTAENEKDLVRDLDAAAEHCPACICSGITQAKLPMVEVEDMHWDCSSTSYSYRYHIDWNYAKARDEYRAEEDRDFRDSVL